MKRSALLCLSLLLGGCTAGEVLETVTRDGGNQVATNIVYDAENKLRLDVFTPNAARNAPTVVFLAGGRWTSGSKDEYRFVGNTLASQSFVVVIPDYRKYPQVRFPEFVEDAARAVKWVTENIPRYGGSPDKLFVMGHSAGAHLAAMLALNPAYLKAAGVTKPLRGMIGMAGPYDFMPITDPTLRAVFAPPEKFEQSQPIFFVDGRNPPLLLIHGEDDEAVWVKNTRSLAQAVRDAGGPVDTLVYDKMSHSCAVAALSNPMFSCGTPDPDPVHEIAKFVRNNARAP
jgi:acetyl esterase/lipase